MRRALADVSIAGHGDDFAFDKQACKGEAAHPDSRISWPWLGIEFRVNTGHGRRRR